MGVASRGTRSSEMLWKWHPTLPTLKWEGQVKVRPLKLVLLELLFQRERKSFGI